MNSPYVLRYRTGDWLSSIINARPQPGLHFTYSFKSEIPQQRQFEDALSRQNGTDQRRLRRGMNFIQMTHRSRLGYESPHTLIKRALNEKIGKRAFGSAFAAE